MATKVNEILIGTSGYDHPELKGSFYPLDLPRKSFLEFYSTKFNALEINSTFYGMPDAERMLSFFQRTEGNVKFSIKANQLLTHKIQRNWIEDAKEFRNALLPLVEKDVLVSILFQFPESFHYIPQNRYYLASLLNEFKSFPKVVEFRHKEWIKESVFNGLNSLNTGIVFCDMPQLNNLPDGFAVRTPFIGNNAYIRLHGRNKNGWYVQASSSKETPRYDYEYSEDELKSFLPIIKACLDEKKTVQMYFNNHPKGTGFMNALQMKNLVEFLKTI